MRCNKCIAQCIDGYEYPEYYCGAGVPEEKMYEFDDGECGCKYSVKAIKARMKKIDEEMHNEIN